MNLGRKHITMSWKNSNDVLNRPNDTPRTRKSRTYRYRAYRTKMIQILISVKLKRQIVMVENTFGAKMDLCSN